MGKGKLVELRLLKKAVNTKIAGDSWFKNQKSYAVPVIEIVFEHFDF
jgi:hypothetical protein